MTLPLIVALDRAEAGEARRIRKLVKQKTKSAADVRAVFDFVRRHGGLDEARARMEALAGDATRRLRAFPPSEARDALIGLAAYIVARKK